MTRTRTIEKLRRIANELADIVDANYYEDFSDALYNNYSEIRDIISRLEDEE